MCRALETGATSDGKRFRHECCDRDVLGRAGIGGAVKAVSVISTGTVQIHPEQLYNTRKPLY